MSTLVTSPPIDILGRRLAVVRSLREQFRMEDDHDLPEIQKTIGLNLWLFGPEFDTWRFEPDSKMAAECSGFFVDPRLDAGELPSSPLSVGFYTLWTSNPFDPCYGIARLVIVVIPRFDVRPGQTERSMIWTCAKHLQEHGSLRQQARVTAFILSHVFDSYEHLKVQHGDLTVIEPKYMHVLLDAAERRLANMR